MRYDFSQTWVLPKVRCRMHHSRLKRPFSPPSFPARRKRWGCRRHSRVENLEMYRLLQDASDAPPEAALQQPTSDTVTALFLMPCQRHNWSYTKKRPYAVCRSDSNLRKLQNRHLPSRIGQQNRQHSTSVGCRLFLYS